MKPSTRHFLIALVVTLAALLVLPQRTRQPQEELLDQQERRCHIDLPGNAPARGLSETMARQFAYRSGTVLTIVLVRDGISSLDSLLEGNSDLVIMVRPDSLPAGLTEARKVSEDIAWIVRDDNVAELRQLNAYLADLDGSADFQRLKKQYLKGKIRDLNAISPYDDLIRETAVQFDWDWRLLAAVIYHESRFSLGANSHKGAVGLMQVRSGRYSADTLMDPRVNLQVGSRYLKRLEKMFEPYAADTTECLKYALAAYNAGEGNLMEIIEYAEKQEADVSHWSSLVEVIPQVKGFRGKQTIAYVDAVLDTYDAYTRLYPR